MYPRNSKITPIPEVPYVFHVSGTPKNGRTISSKLSTPISVAFLICCSQYTYLKTYSQLNEEECPDYKVNCGAREGALGCKVNCGAREGTLGCKVNCGAREGTLGCKVNCGAREGALGYFEFDLVFKEMYIDYKNGNTLVVSSKLAYFLKLISGTLSF
jgi:hypothetical protein